LFMFLSTGCPKIEHIKWPWVTDVVTLFALKAGLPMS